MLVIPPPRLWIRKFTAANPNGSVRFGWNGPLKGDPQDGSGFIALPGLDAHIAPSDPNPGLFVTVQGADSNLFVCMNSTTRAIAPLGFYPGWPKESGAGGFEGYLDNNKIFGSAIVTGYELIDYVHPHLGIGFRVTCPSAYGAVQSVDGWRWGKFYFEIENLGNAFDTNFAGGGVARMYPGLNYNFWANNCQYSSGDLNGGGGYIGGVLADNYAGNIGADGAAALVQPFTFQTGEILGIAIDVAPHTAFYPASLIPVTLPCIPCCSFSNRPA